MASQSEAICQLVVYFSQYHIPFLVLWTFHAFVNLLFLMGSNTQSTTSSLAQCLVNGKPAANYE